MIAKLYLKKALAFAWTFYRLERKTSKVLWKYKYLSDMWMDVLVPKTFNQEMHIDKTEQLSIKTVRKI